MSYFCWIPKFVTVLSQSRHCALFWANWIQITPLCPVSLRYILIYAFISYLEFFFHGFWLKCCMHFPHTYCMSRPSHIPLFDDPIIYGEYLVYFTYYCDQIKEDEMGGHVTRILEMRNAYSILVGKHGGKMPLGRPSRRWDDNIRMYFNEIGWEGVD